MKIAVLAWQTHPVTKMLMTELKLSRTNTTEVLIHTDSEITSNFCRGQISILDEVLNKLRDQELFKDFLEQLNELQNEENKEIKDV